MTAPVIGRDALDPTRIALAILAGGEGRRMGTPKDQLIARGKPILRFLVEQLAWPGPTVLILGQGREAPPGKEACSAIAHDQVAGQGPLRGILTAIEASSAPATVILPLDMPWLGRDQLEFVVKSLSDRPAALGVLLSRPSEGAPLIEPFPCIFRRQASHLIKAHLAREEFAIRALARDDSIVVLQSPDEWPSSVWNNVNAPGDLPDWITLGS